MPTRNTAVLKAIIEVIGDVPADALAQLEERFKDVLLIVAGDVPTVAEFASSLRLAITTQECATVLDYIGNESLAAITINHVEDAINDLFDDRFIEPTPERKNRP